MIKKQKKLNLLQANIIREEKNADQEKIEKPTVIFNILCKQENNTEKQYNKPAITFDVLCYRKIMANYSANFNPQSPHCFLEFLKKRRHFQNTTSTPRKHKMASFT